MGGRGEVAMWMVTAHHYPLTVCSHSTRRSVELTDSLTHRARTLSQSGLPKSIQSCDQPYSHVTKSCDQPRVWLCLSLCPPETNAIANHFGSSLSPFPPLVWVSLYALRWKPYSTVSAMSSQLNLDISFFFSLLFLLRFFPSLPSPLSSLPPIFHLSRQCSR